ncbi:protein-export chaperone SecB [Paenibacillus sp. FSL R5-0486]|uniref:protein-export chaperone SecB n=1 Tax=Paenibacillus sp. FSL R5-0486 TaxID=2921645 RepID=UPI0030D88484
MEDEIISTLRFNDYKIDRMIFSRNHNFNDIENEELEIEFKFSSEVHVSTDKSKAIVVLTCRLFDEDFNENNFPFFLELTMRGYFDCENVDFENFELNSMAILLPYLRSTITSFTAQAGISPVIIPTINVYNLFHEHDSDD